MRAQPGLFDKDVKREGYKRSRTAPPVHQTLRKAVVGGKIQHAHAGGAGRDFAVVLVVEGPAGKARSGGER